MNALLREHICLMKRRTFTLIFHHQLISYIDDIEDPGYHMSRGTFFEPVLGFACTWMALRARNSSPKILATLNPQSTCHGPQPGPKHAQWCSGGFPACPGAESTRKDPAGRQKHVDAQKKHLCIRNVYLVPGIKKGNNGHKKPTVARPYGGSTAPMNQRTTSAM